MTPNELLMFLKNHNLTYQGLAKLLGTTDAAISHWMSGRRSMSLPISRLLRLFDKHPELMGEFGK